MNISTFKNINISHLYFTEPRLKYIINIQDSFFNYNSFDLTKDTIASTFTDTIFIEINKLNKDSAKILNKIVQKNSSKEIFIFCEDIENKFLLKFALHFSLNMLYSLDETNKNIDNLLQNVSKKIEIKKEEKTQIEISKKINSFFALMLFHDDKLVFANDKTKKLFNHENLSELENMAKNNKKMNSLVRGNKHDKIDIIMENKDGEDWVFGCFLDVFDNGIDRLITIIPEHKAENEDTFLSTMDRFMFIEMLKDRLANNSLSQTNMSLVCVNISNYEKLLDSNDNMAIHDFLKKFIEKLCFYKESCQDLSQWNPHFFVFLVEGDSFKKAKEQLDYMHQKLIYNEVDSTIVPIITSSILSIEKLEMNDVIDSIEQISSHKFKITDFNSGDYFEINHLNDYLDENEQINNYLQSCIATKTQLKLLNIYKGLCINTASKVLQIKDNSYFLQCEDLQTYSMKFDSKTVIQSPDLPKDIEADIKYINLEKQYAILENLRYLEFSANNRQHTRVQPSMRTPLTFRYSKYSYQGEILDISMQAMAIKFNHSLGDELNSKEVQVQFKLLDDSVSEGFVSMDISGKVINVSEIDITKSKVVVMINPESPYDSYLLKYMYDRQKELILELKRATKVQRMRG